MDRKNLDRMSSASFGSQRGPVQPVAVTAGVTRAQWANETVDAKGVTVRPLYCSLVHEVRVAVGAERATLDDFW